VFFNVLGRPANELVRGNPAMGPASHPGGVEILLVLRKLECAHVIHLNATMYQLKQMNAFLFGKNDYCERTDLCSFEVHNQSIKYFRSHAIGLHM